MRETYNKRLLLLGMSAPSLLELTKWDFSYWTEVWSLNEAYIVIPSDWYEELNFTRWFELHPDTVFAEGSNPRNPEHLKTLNSLNVDIFVREEIEGLEHQVKFNYIPIIGEFGWDWYQSTLAWMLSCAMYEQKAYKGRTFNEIGLFGIDMIGASEYDVQRPGFMHLLYVAKKELGIQFIIPQNSGLFTKPALYGIDQ